MIFRQAALHKTRRNSVPLANPISTCNVCHFLRSLCTRSTPPSMWARESRDEGRRSTLLAHTLAYGDCNEQTEVCSCSSSHFFWLLLHCAHIYCLPLLGAYSFTPLHLLSLAPPQILVLLINLHYVKTNRWQPGYFKSPQ